MLPYVSFTVTLITAFTLALVRGAATEIISVMPGPAEIDELLSTHNNIHQKHFARPLTWNSEAASYVFLTVVFKPKLANLLTILLLVQTLRHI
jgi:hypothetical protein